MTSKTRINHIALKDIRDVVEKQLIAEDQKIALKDLKSESFFHPCADDDGPYDVFLSVEENRLVFRIINGQSEELPLLVLSLKPYRRIVKDYFMIVESYDTAVREGNHSKIEAIDMGRRGLHNEGAQLLMDRLEDKIKMDMDTARRLFTLICVLHTQSSWLRA